jgi:3-hydroxyisobutyrate dehydrogenase-like beta-hydroxyacid dehydrogenase
MAGGDPSVFLKAEPVLASYAAYLRHVGPLGAGMRLKLINNLLFGAQIALASDAFRLAEETGIAADVLADVISRSSGASTALGILARHQRPGAGLAGMRAYLQKDITSALAAAESEGLDLGTLAQLAGAWR